MLHVFVISMFYTSFNKCNLYGNTTDFFVDVWMHWHFLHCQKCKEMNQTNINKQERLFATIQLFALVSNVWSN